MNCYFEAHLQRAESSEVGEHAHENSECSLNGSPPEHNMISMDQAVATSLRHCTGEQSYHNFSFTAYQLCLILNWLSCETKEWASLTAYSGSCPFFSVADWEPFPLAQVSSMTSNLLHCQWICSSTCWSPICFSKSKEATFSCTCCEIVATGFLSFDKLTPDSSSRLWQEWQVLSQWLQICSALLLEEEEVPSYFAWKKPANNLSAHVWTQTWSGVGEITVIPEYFFRYRTTSMPKLDLYLEETNEQGL